LAPGIKETDEIGETGPGTVNYELRTEDSGTNSPENSLKRELFIFLALILT
jgi:hypothetical protein